MTYDLVKIPICKKHGIEKRRHKKAKSATGKDKYGWNCPECDRERSAIRYARRRANKEAGIIPDPGPKRAAVPENVRPTHLPQPAILGQNLDTNKAIRFFNELCRCL